jgi:hypothetical protein
VTVLSNTGKLEYVPPIEKLLYSVVYFVGFLLVMRLDMMLTTVVLFLIFLIYFIELNQEFYLEMGKTINDPGDKAIYENNQYWITMSWPFTIRLFPVNQSSFIFINKIETVIFYIIILFLIIGFISYGGEIKDTVNKNNNLTWIKVITDTSICKMNERKGFWEYFKIGLGLKV